MLKKWMLITGCASGLLFASQLPQVLAQGRTNGRNSAPPRRADSKRQLGALWNGMWRIEGSMTPLSKAQAKRIVATVRPWSGKNSMTEAQAKSVISSLNGVLTPAQKSVVGDLDKDGPRRDGPPPGRRGDGPPPRGRRGDGPRDDGPPRMDENATQMMATLNPFYAPTGYDTFKTLPPRMQTNLLHRYQEVRATLISLSRKAG